MTTYSTIAGARSTIPTPHGQSPTVRGAVAGMRRQLLLYVSSGGAYGVCLPGQLPAGAVGLRVVIG